VIGLVSRVFTQQDDSFFTALVRLSYEPQATAPFATVPYDVLFNSKVQSILRDTALATVVFSRLPPLTIPGGDA
jgi:hypothetical protein